MKASIISNLKKARSGDILIHKGRFSIYNGEKVLSLEGKLPPSFTIPQPYSGTYWDGILPADTLMTLNGGPWREEISSHFSFLDVPLENSFQISYSWFQVGPERYLIMADNWDYLMCLGHQTPEYRVSKEAFLKLLEENPRVKRYSSSLQEINVNQYLPQNLKEDVISLYLPILY